MEWTLRSLLTLLILLSSCSLFESDDRTLQLETNRERYDLDTDGAITVVVENVSSSVVYYNTCMPTTLQELDGNRVITSLDFPACDCICLEELEPGETWQHTVYMTSITANRAQLDLAAENKYRLRLAFYRDREMKKLLEEEERRMNQFVLTE